jgi:hypothetical protein
MKKKVCKTFKYLFLIIFMVLLSLDIFLFGLREMSKKYMSEDKIKEYISSINVLDLLKDEDGNELESVTALKKELADAGFPSEVVDDVLNSEPVKEVTSTIVTDTINYVLYDEPLEVTDSINSDSIITFVRDNMGTVTDELQKNNVPKSDILTKEKQEEIINQLEEKAPEIEKKVNEVVDKVEEKIKSSSQYEQVEEYQKKLNQVLRVIRFIYSNTVYMALIGIGILLICLIILFTHSFYAYFKYLGISALLSGGMYFATTYLLDILKDKITDIPVFFQTFVSSIIEGIEKSMYDYVKVCLIVGVCLIALNIIIHVIKEKRENKRFDAI